MRGEAGSRSPVPDTLSLLCLRQQDNVATSILKLDDVLDELSGEEIKLLEEAEFTVNRPASFEKQESIDKLPLLRKGENGLYVQDLIIIMLGQAILNIIQYWKNSKG